MEKAIVVRGKMADPRRIELEEPVTELTGSVEVVLRSTAAPSLPSQDVFALISSLQPGVRSKDDIDRQIAEERASWVIRVGEPPG